MSTQWVLSEIPGSGVGDKPRWEMHSGDAAGV